MATSGDVEARESAPISYGDLRITSDRRAGPCLFWVRRAASGRTHTHTLPGAALCGPERLHMHMQVVPDVAKGFNVPDFYAQFLADRGPPEGSSQGRG